MNHSEKKSCFQSCLGFFTSGIVVFVLIVILVIGGYILFRGAGAFLIVANELAQANAIVILSGGDETRMAEALELYEAGYANIIILTETGRELENMDVLHSFDIRVQLETNGVPSGNILITDHIVGSTLDEAVAVKNLLSNRQFTSAIIVTDPYHTKRTLIIFRDIFADSQIKLIIRPVTPSWYNSRSWFLSRQGWQFTLQEYLKLLGYLLGIQKN